MNTRPKLTILVGILILALLGGAGATFASRAVAAPPAAPVAQAVGAPMPPLAEAACTLAGTVRTCHIWALPGTLTMPDGVVVPVWGFADSAAGPALVPGPVIRANAGETVNVVVHNGIAGERVSLTVTGQSGLIPDMNGAPSGGSRTYRFDANVVGLYLYEAGPTANGPRQSMMGLFGPFVIEGPTPTWNQEAFVLLHEIDTAFNADPRNFILTQFKPEYWLINGRAFPDTGWIDVNPGAVLLMRYINAGQADRGMGLLGLTQQMVAMDGVALPYGLGYNTVPLQPGQSVDVLVQMPGAASEGTLYPLYEASLIQHNNNQRLTDMRVAFGGMMAFLRTGAGGPPPPVDNTPPDVTGVTVTPNTLDYTAALPVTDVTVDATASDPLVAGLQSNIASAEAFIDVVGAAGSGYAMAAADGLFDTPVEAVTVAIPTTAFDALADGAHTIYVVASDAVGNTSAPASATITIIQPPPADTTAPDVTGVTVTPNTLDFTAALPVTDVTVDATASDPATGGVQSNIAGAEAFIDAVGAPGSGYAMVAADGLFDTPVEAVTVAIPTTAFEALTEGVHTLYVVATDAAGNVSAPASATITIIQPAAGDVTPPVVTGLTNISTNPDRVTLQALVTDTESNIAQAVWFLGTNPVGATTYPMFATLGGYNSTTETVRVIINVANWPANTYEFSVMAQDTAGNWSSVVTLAVPVQ